jgi:hypothetical protein
VQVGEVIPYHREHAPISIRSCRSRKPPHFWKWDSCREKVTKTLFRLVGLEPRHVTFVKNVHETFLANVEGSEICPLFSRRFGPLANGMFNGLISDVSLTFLCVARVPINRHVTLTRLSCGCILSRSNYFRQKIKNVDVRRLVK